MADDMKRIEVTGLVREYLEKMGQTDCPSHVDVPAEHFHKHHQELRKQFPRKAKEVVEAHAQARTIYHSRHRNAAQREQSAVVVLALMERSLKKLFWAFGLVILLLLVILFFSARAHAQIDVITFLDSGALKIKSYAAPFKIKCSTNVTCAAAGNTLSITASASGATAWSGITAATNANAGSFISTGNTFDFSGVTLMKLRFSAGLTTSTNGDSGYDTTNNRWHFWQGGADRLMIASTNVGASGQAFLSNADGSGAFSDPIVSGPDAVGAAPTKNPVQMGGIFLTTPATLTNNQVGALQLDNLQNALVRINFALPSGTNVIGHIIVDTAPSTAVTNVGTFAVQAALNAETTKIIGEAIPVTTATTTDTALRCTLVSAASTNATLCKNASGNVYGFRFINTTTTVYYLRMYNSSSSPTCSSATGFIESIPIPPAAASGGAGGVVAIEDFGEGYSTGIAFCFTGGSSSTDNTNAAVGVLGTILYK